VIFLIGIKLFSSMLTLTKCLPNEVFCTKFLDPNQCFLFKNNFSIKLLNKILLFFFAKLNRSSPTARVGICACMKVITKPILSAVIEIRVLKQTSAIYFFKVGILDLAMTKMKRQSKRQNKTNFNFSCFRGMYIYCKY
jgi:hypothetical protein